MFEKVSSNVGREWEKWEKVNKLVVGEVFSNVGRKWGKQKKHSEFALHLFFWLPNSKTLSYFPSLLKDKAKLIFKCQCMREKWVCLKLCQKQVGAVGG